MLGKLLSIFNVLDWIFGWLHDLKIRREIATEQQLDLSKGKIDMLREEAKSAQMTDAQVQARLERTGGYRDDSDL